MKRESSKRGFFRVITRAACTFELAASFLWADIDRDATGAQHKYPMCTDEEYFAFFGRNNPV